jgi:hypothetical protein
MEIAKAMACLETKQTTRAAAEQLGMSAARISQANVVLEHLPDLADSEIAGAMSRNDAHEKANRLKTAMAVAMVCRAPCGLTQLGIPRPLCRRPGRVRCVRPRSSCGALGANLLRPRPGLKKTTFRGMPIISGGIGLIGSWFLSWGDWPISGALEWAIALEDSNALGES